MKQCPSCSHSVDDETMVCPVCGHNFKTNSSSNILKQSFEINSNKDETRVVNGEVKKDEEVNNSRRSRSADLIRNQINISSSTKNEGNTIKKDSTVVKDEPIVQKNVDEDRENITKEETKSEEKPVNNYSNTRPTPSQDSIKKESNLIECPKCGYTFSSLETKCPHCGTEVRRDNTKKTLDDFRREYDSKRTIDEKVSLIEYYDVPVDVESIIKFLSLAESHITPNVFIYADQHSDDERKLCNAWIKKYDHIYNGVNITKNDKKVIDIHKKYQNKIEQIDNSKKKKAKNKVLLRSSLIVVIIILGIAASLLLKKQAEVKQAKVDKIEQNMIVLNEEVNNLIANDKLEEAKLSALGLKGDPSVDKKQAKKWTAISEDLIEEINNKLIIKYNASMNELVNKVYEYIAIGDYVNARAMATNVKGDEVITPSDSNKWEETRQVLFKAIEDAEKDKYSQYINDLISEANNLFNKKQYAKAKEVAVNIHGNDKTSAETNENWDKIRKELIEKIEHAEFIAKGNIMVGSSSSELKNKHYSSVVKALKAAGFRKVTTKELGDLPLGTTEGVGLVESVFIGSANNFSKTDYFNKNDEVIVNYHTAYDDGKVEVGASSKDLVGKNYQDVVKILETSGFKRVKTQKIPDLVMGFMTKEFEVESVSIDGLTSFSKSDRFDTHAEIIVSYHVFDEEELTVESSDIKIGYNGEDCIGKDYTKVKDDLVKAGFTNISTVAVADGEDGLFGGNINEIAAITVNGDSTFTKSQKYPSNVGIVITYHVLAENNEVSVEQSGIEVGYIADKLVGEKFDKVISKLEKSGFTNIKSETTADAVDKLLGGNVDEVFEVSIDGNTTFNKTDRFDPNSEVVIKYHVLP